MERTHLAAAARIEELAERNKELTLQLLATHGQAADSVDKLAKAVEALELIVVDSTWGLEHQTYMKCRKALAEIKSGVATTPYGLEGESHD